MATVQNEQIISLTAGEDLSAKQYYLATISTGADNTASLAGDGNKAFVILNEPSTGQAASLAIGGVTKVVAGAAFTRGDKLASNGSGKAITAVAGGTKHVVLFALESAGAENDVVRVLAVTPTLLA